jgi:hypothetical protein
MASTQLIEPSETKQCHSCFTELPACDKYCRQCGIHQKVPRDDDATVQLLSGALIGTLTQSLTAKTARSLPNPFGARLVAAIAVLPIWLLIILLSPLDAYFVARVAKSRIDISWAKSK